MHNAGRNAMHNAMYMDAAVDDECFRLGSTLANLEQQSLLELWVETNIKTYSRTCDAH